MPSRLALVKAFCDGIAGTLEVARPASVVDGRRCGRAGRRPGSSLLAACL
jgi:hypothetical protein